MNTIALMYHGIFSAHHSVSNMPAEDLPYAISESTFAEHLSLLNGKPVQLTFDDGDAGWYYSALPLLKEFQRKAIFFVTPELIGTPGYCDWEQLRALVLAGHQVGTHGLTHRFLPDLTEQQCVDELAISKSILEDRLGVKVTTLSFPGGRFGRREVQLAKRAGYQFCFTSEPGRLKTFDIDMLGHDEPNQALIIEPRIAVRADTGNDWLAGLIEGRTTLWGRIYVVHWIKLVLKKLLGNQGYHGLYRLLRS
ncbi:MAG: polysaccharide deacetylase family protein [Alcanivoracaceae bacterium]|nr:polysaccharide deacetylase family protein [Alcanivoracaceae bacterium]